MTDQKENKTFVRDTHVDFLLYVYGRFSRELSKCFTASNELKEAYDEMTSSDASGYYPDTAEEFVGESVRKNFKFQPEDMKIFFWEETNNDGEGKKENEAVEDKQC